MYDNDAKKRMPFVDLVSISDDAFFRTVATRTFAGLKFNEDARSAIIGEMSIHGSRAMGEREIPALLELCDSRFERFCKVFKPVGLGVGARRPVIPAFAETYSAVPYEFVPPPDGGDGSDDLIDFLGTLDPS